MKVFVSGDSPGILPLIKSFRVWLCALVSRLSITGAFRILSSPSTLSSLLCRYTVAIVAKHFSFISPRLKCLLATRNSKPNTAVSNPFSSTAVMCGPFRYWLSAWNISSIIFVTMRSCNWIFLFLQSHLPDHHWWTKLIKRPVLKARTYSSFEQPRRLDSANGHRLFVALRQEELQR